MSIRNKLLLAFLSVAFISGALISSVALLNATQTIKSEIENSLNALADQKLHELNDYIHEKEQIVKLTAELPLVAESLQQFTAGFSHGTESNTYLLEQKKYASYYSNLMSRVESYDLLLISPEGDIVFSIKHEADFATNLKTGPYKNTQLAHVFDLASTLLETRISPFESYQPTYSAKQENTKQHSSFIAAPVFAGDTLAGVLAIQLNDDDYYPLAKNYSGLKNTGEIVISKLDGNDVLVIAPLRHTPNAAFNLRYALGSDIAKPIQWSALGSKGSGLSVGYEDTEILAAWRYSPELQWGMVLKIEADEAFIEANNLLQDFMILGLIIAIFACSIAFYLSKRISDPILQLVDATERISTGDLSQITGTRSNDELGVLTSSFNHMLTVREQHEAALKKSTLEAESAAIAKSEFLASMSHEIRTPMNGVLGMLSLLQKDKLTQEQLRKVNLASVSAESLLTLINDILDFSKIDSGKLALEELDFNPSLLLAELTESMAWRAQEKGLELILDVSTISDTFVRGDPGRLRQILTNLVGNAIKFTAQGEVIIRGSLKQDNENQLLTCSVHDSGIGIAQSQLEHLFDSFTQADSSTTREYGGTGLGLSIAKKLCSAMSGSLSVTSEQGQGSCFEFSVNLKASSLSQKITPDLNMDKVTLLIVDDNSFSRKALAEQLTLWGATVTEAQDGHSALTILNEQHFNSKSNNDATMFNLAIIDMNMPNMDGAELGKRMRQDQRFNSVNLVMMTSIDNNEDAQFFSELGFNAYFPKPATAPAMYKALNSLLEGFNEDSKNSKDNKKENTTDNEINETFSKVSSLVPGQPPASSQSIDNDDIIDWPEGIRILLVEDNIVNQEVVLGLLKEFGLTADIAADGQEALELLSGALLVEAYTLVLMDCQMPALDGYGATRAIRNGDTGEQNSSIPILAMTANAMKGDSQKCIDSGMNDYISKPLNFDLFRKKLIALLIKSNNSQSKNINIV